MAARNSIDELILERTNLKMNLQAGETLRNSPKFIDRRSHSFIDHPDVSVIIPVYNAMPYLADAVESVLNQKDVKIELICVDDGSNDGGIEYLLGRLRHPNFRLILQDNSGSPSSPRNRGIDVARGKYLYFLDADDVLYDEALVKMFVEAENTGNDHVLGRIRGIGGRSAMPQIFRSRSSQADLLKSYAWHNLSPTGKLIRKSLVDSLNLRFNQDQWVGEDQIFFAELYLSGSGISILNDQDYVGYRQRDDGGNITSRRQSLSDKQKTLCRLADVIATHCAESDARDQLAQRLFTSTMPGVFAGIYQAAESTDRAKFLKALQESVVPLFSPAIESKVSKYLAIIISMIAHGLTRELDRFLEEVDSNGIQYVLREGKLVVDTSVLESSTISGINLELPSSGVLRTKQTNLYIHSRKLVSEGTVAIPDTNVKPTDIVLILRERNSGNEREIAASSVTYTEDRAGLLADITFEVDSTVAIDKGAWGTFIRCRWGESWTEARWGKRTKEVKNQKLYLEVKDAKPVVAYFNAGYENLTLDVCASVHSETTVAQLREKYGREH